MAVLGGGVTILYNGQYISCTEATINEKTEEMTLLGGIVIASPQAYIEGDRAIVNYRQNTGTFFNAFVKSGQVHFEGSVIRKTGELTYEADDAQFTACTTCPAAWTFSGTRVDAELGGYAYIKRSWIKVADFRVLWLPYLIVPLKSERQTGLLVPQFEFAGSNFGLGIPYFWAISRSQDATFTLRYYTQRGLKGLLTYRYMLSPTSEGELSGAILRDQTFQDDLSAPGRNFGSQAYRWYLVYDHKYDLPYGFTQKTKLNLVSDLKYPRDFPLEMLGQGDPALENRVSLTRNTELTHSSVEVDYYINQLKYNWIDTNRDAVHRWPEIKYAVHDTPLFGNDLLFRFSADYVKFARDGLAYDDVSLVNGTPTIDTARSLPASGNSTPGVFDPSMDLVRTGQRLDLQPEVSLPFRVGPYFDVLPSLQFRHTQYSFDISPVTRFNDAL